MNVLNANFCLLHKVLTTSPPTYLNTVISVHSTFLHLTLTLEVQHQALKLTVPLSPFLQFTKLRIFLTFSPRRMVVDPYLVAEVHCRFKRSLYCVL